MSADEFDPAIERLFAQTPRLADEALFLADQQPASASILPSVSGPSTSHITASTGAPTSEESGSTIR